MESGETISDASSARVTEEWLLSRDEVTVRGEWCFLRRVPGWDLLLFRLLSSATDSSSAIFTRELEGGVGRRNSLIYDIIDRLWIQFKK